MYPTILETLGPKEVIYLGPLSNIKVPPFSSSNKSILNFEQFIVRNGRVC